MNSPIDRIAEFQSELVAIRRDIHAHPEMGLEEHRTAARVATFLEAQGIEVHTGVGKTGVVGVLHGRDGPNGRSIGLRADMDCLPMIEDNPFAHRSSYHGFMHACGHDGHTTMLLGAARYLAQTRAFAGTVYLYFQPAEEGLGGAQHMIDDGLFDRFPAERVFALHNWPEIAPGRIVILDGPVMAAADRFRIVIRGKGGHAAKPHFLRDPVLAAAHVITALQSIVSRNVHPLDSGVVSVAQLDTSGTSASNVVPEEVGLYGTARSFRDETRELIERRMREIATSVASAFGAEAMVEYTRGYPATVNHPAEARFAAEVASRLFGAENVIRDHFPTMGAEDFAYMLERRPGAYCMIGQGDGGRGGFLHTRVYDFNDDILPLGAGFLASLAEAALPLA